MAGEVKEIKQVSISELISLEVPGSDVFEQRRNWEYSDSVRIGDWIAADDEGDEDFNELEKRARDFNSWFLGPENPDQWAKAALVAAPVSQTITVDERMHTINWALVLVPVERSLRGEEWRDGELFLKAQQMVEGYWGHETKKIEIRG